MSKSVEMDEHVEQRPVWAWIDQSALRHNARRALEYAEGRTVIGVVKADGYGHGAAVVAHALLAEGIARLAVVSVAEGGDLRRAGIVAPILLLGGIENRAAGERAVKWGLTPVIQDERGLSLAASLGRAGAPVTVEVEVDTGMRRMGVMVASARKLIDGVRNEPGVVLGGIFTHLARADESDLSASCAQAQAFADLLEEAGRGAKSVEAVASEPGSLAGVHLANSGGLVRLTEIEKAVPGLRSTAVRPGLMLYGATPLEGESAESLDLEPAMSLAARVVSVRRIDAGDSVGYGGEWTAEKGTTIATLPLGYADGIPRAAFGEGRVYLAGAMHRIVGRVSMDSLCVDMGDTAVDIGDVATIFGRTPEGKRVSVEDFAEAAGTVAYEILVGIGARVPRWVGAGWPPGDRPEDVDPGD
jgi:alanine racemase